jgi:hypothetical protein
LSDLGASAKAIAFDSPIGDVPEAYGYYVPKNDCQKLGFEQASALLESM